MQLVPIGEQWLEQVMAHWTSICFRAYKPILASSFVDVRYDTWLLYLKLGKAKGSPKLITDNVACGKHGGIVTRLENSG